MRCSLAVALVACMGLAAASCSKSATEPFIFSLDTSAPNQVDPGIIKNETLTYNSSFDVDFPAVKVFTWDYFKRELYTVRESFKNLVDVHIEVLPLYVFGTDEVSGDYYSINGYMVAHNATCFKKEVIYSEDKSSVQKFGWYMADMCMDVQLLDSLGNAVTNENVSFMVTPEPSTTIGETTYKSGFSFTLAPSLTFGTAKKAAEGKSPSWKTTLLGSLSFGFCWDNSSSQVLPDQTVVMWTGPKDRTVSYDFTTNNLHEEASVSAIPAVARNDQRVDFGWVWKVKSGAYAAKDYSFGNMKMKVTIHPKYKVNIDGLYNVITHEKLDDGRIIDKDNYNYVKNYFVDSSNSSMDMTVVLPGMNRIPTAKFNLKNCTRSYMTGIEVYRTGEYGTVKAYNTVDGTCDTNESADGVVRAGTYDIVYELKDGDTGESRGLFMISGVEFKANDSLSLTTFDGKRI